MPRRAPLWPETIEAVRAARQASKAAKTPEDRPLAFRTRLGAAWKPNGMSSGYARIAKRAGIYREGVTFGSFRSTFQTIADNADDPIATSVIMGHTDNSMAGRYRQRVLDEKLVAVTDHVRNWLFGEPG
ncbi:MAG: hypothetical protein AAGJ46_19395 [Planctomycetota bacterium]